MLRFAPGVLELILVIFCFVDAISARDDEVRNLPRWLWIVLIVFLPIVGPVSWLIAGRPMATQPSRLATEFPEYDRPGRYSAPDPEADAAFLRKVRERAEEQRQKAAREKAEQQRLEAERERAKQEPPTDEGQAVEDR
jgi:hypothetical protein